MLQENTSSRIAVSAPAGPTVRGRAPLKQAGRWLRRMAFLVHRWMGITLGLLMAVWALSGIVMIYVAFPETTQHERLAGLEPLKMEACCAEDALPRAFPMAQASVEMLGGDPVLYWDGAQGGGIINLRSGSFVDINDRLVAHVAETYMRQSIAQNTGEAVTKLPDYTVETIDRDQWTVYGRFRQLQPLYKFAFDDAAGTNLYVSGASGEVVQDTTAHERFWNWLGAVPHWLYFTTFRENQPLWYNFVVYASLLGVFLTVTGLYVGIRQFRRGKRLSPYRGISMWHHWTGLVFGILTLTWVVSGLFSMQPWGMLEGGSGPGQEMSRLAGRSGQVEDVGQMLSALADHDLGGAVKADLSVQQGAAYAILSYGDGSRQRIALGNMAPDPLAEADLRELAQIIRPGEKVTSQELITAPDAYHYAHKSEIVLPAWRIIFADRESTRFYFDPATGELINYVDADGRAYRWLHYGLHRLDLFAALRQRPVWDIVIVPLMIGVSLLCVLGFALGVQHLTRRRRSNRRR